MMTNSLDHFKQIWFLDFEFSQADGERPSPVCLVAKEYRTGQTIRLFQDELKQGKSPFFVGTDILFIAYYASAEIGCFLALDWPTPSRLLDLYVEFRCRTSGLPVVCGYGLLGALAYFGLDGIETIKKETMRQLAMRDGPYTDEEKNALLGYCQSDVDALERLLPAILPDLDIPRALLRGRYMIAAAKMEWIGVPIDTPTFLSLRDNWQKLQMALINRLDKWGIWVNGSFRSARFTEFLQEHRIPWPRLESGNLAFDDDTFRSMAKAYPELWPIRELRYALSKLRLNSLTIGSDGRNRCMLSAFGSKTGRNQPSNKKSIFGPSVWLRGLIKPTEGRALAYVDWEQQEFGIAAVLSKDKTMINAYASGDPYLAFALQAGAVPPDATRRSHSRERERFKFCALGVQYGIGEKKLALLLGESIAAARELMRLHKETYKDFWTWSEAALNHALLIGELHTVFGWRVHVEPNVNPRSLRNFPMQANGAEMLRLACCLATEQGIKVCAPVHDALLIEAADGEIEDVVHACQEAMQEASETVLFGNPLRTDTKVIRYPERYTDPRGMEMWKVSIDLLSDIGNNCFMDTPPVTEKTIYLDGSGTPVLSYVL